MKTQFKHNDEVLQFERNWFTGLFKCNIGKKTIVIDSPFDPRTHFWLTLTRQKEIDVNGNLLKVIHRRPLMLSFSKPHEYEFWINGELMHKHAG